jgi:GNAT superfamily N-acetyltransferase
MKKIEIREATLADAKNISKLALSLAHYYNDDDPSGISPYFAKKITVEAFEGYLCSVNPAYDKHYVAEVEGELVAYSSWLNDTHLLYLFVSENHHKKGLGRVLVEYGLREKEHKLYTVNASLYAVPFYKRLGFVASALVQHHHGMTYLPMVWDRVKVLKKKI